MQIRKIFNRTACLSVALLGLGLVGCAHHPERTASGYWNDKMTTRRVEGALKSAPTYKYSALNVSTFDGNVSLGGFVNTEDQRRQAIDIARNTSGVRQVIDNLVVKPVPTGRAPVIENPTRLPAQTPGGATTTQPQSENPNLNQNPDTPK